MVVKYNELGNGPDILNVGMHNLYFPDVEGVDGETLRLYHTHITLPQHALGHVLVKILGQSIGFRGSNSFENTVSAGFVDTVEGKTYKSLWNWMNISRNFRNDTSKLKKDYARPGLFKVFDTTGKAVYTFKLHGMFPLTIEMPEFGETDAPAEFQVQFNCDYIEEMSGLHA